VVFVNQLSPVLMACAGIRYKRKFGKKVLLYCLDLWPESLVVGGVGRNSIVYKMFHKISKWIYQNVDKILVTSKSFSKYFEDEFNIFDTDYLPQYAEEIFAPEMCKKMPNGKLDLMFAGNIGIAQNVETIVKAAALTKKKANIHWHIVGDGSELDKLKREAEKVDNITFYGRKSLDEMPQFYAMADVMLITMEDNPVISLTLPGKIQSYMAAGKPIIGAINGETRDIVRDAQCGYCVAAGDADGLARCAIEISQGKIDLEMLGKNSKSYIDIHFSKQKFVDEIEKKLKQLSE